MDYFILGIVAFYLGYKVNEKIMYITFSKMMKEAGITNKELDKFIGYWAPGLTQGPELADEPQVEIRLEQHNDVIYAYRKDNEEFLAQGGNQDELFKKIGERFQDVKFVIHQADGAELLQKNNG